MHLDWLVGNKVCFVYHPCGGCLCKVRIRLDANKHFSGSFVVSINFRKSVVSLRYCILWLISACAYSGKRKDSMCLKDMRLYDT